MLRSTKKPHSADNNAAQGIPADNSIKKKTETCVLARSHKQGESSKMRSADALAQRPVTQPNLNGVSLNNIKDTQNTPMDDISLTSRFFENLSLADSVEKDLVAALSPELNNTTDVQVTKAPAVLPKSIQVPSRQMMDMFDGKKIDVWKDRVFSHIGQVLALLTNYKNRIAHHQGQANYHRFLKNPDVKSFVIADLMQQTFALRKLHSKINPLLDRAKAFPDFAVHKDAQMVQISGKALQALEKELINDLLIAENLGFASR